MLSFQNKIKRAIRTCVILFLMGVSLASGQEQWLAGAGRSSITPTVPLMMAGYASRTTPATEKNIDLWAKVLFLKDRGGNRGVLISLDLVGIGRPLSQRVCRSEEHTSELQSLTNLVCRLLLEKKKIEYNIHAVSYIHI